MPYLNTVTLMGHLVADPELRSTPGGEKVANFSLGVNLKAKDGKEHAEFFNVEVWGGWAENLTKTARKGALVLVEGRLRQETWKDKESGENRSRVKVRARRAFHVQVQYEGRPDPDIPPEEESPDVPY